MSTLQHLVYQHPLAALSLLWIGTLLVGGLLGYALGVWRTKDLLADQAQRGHAIGYVRGSNDVLRRLALRAIQPRRAQSNHMQ